MLEMSGNNFSWRVDKSYEWNLTVLARTKCIQDLFNHAKLYFEIEEDKAKEILKAAGHKSFKKEMYFVYLNILKRHWKHLKEVKFIEPRSERKRLIEVSLGAKWIRVEGVDHLVLTGTDEEKKAYWELQTLLREENVKRCRKKWSPLPNE